MTFSGIYLLWIISLTNYNAKPHCPKCGIKTSVIRDYEADNVTFKYNQDSVTNMFGKLEITNGSWTIDLVTSTVTGASNGLPSISTADSVTTVVLPHLGEEVYYTMNVQKFVEGPSEMTINVVEGWNMIGLSTNGQLVDDAGVVVAGSIYWYGGSSYEQFEEEQGV